MVYLMIGFIGFVLSMLFLLILQFVSYYPLYRMSKNRGLIDPIWMFMPIYNIYMMCKLVTRNVKIFGKITVKKDDFPKKMIKIYLWLIALNIIGIAMTSIVTESFSGMIEILLIIFMFLMMLILAIPEYYITYKIRLEIIYPYLRDETTDRILAITSLFIPIIFWIFTLLMMNKSILEEQ